MFLQQKKLTVLNVPSSRVAMLYRSETDIQLALPDMPSQMASAFLLLLRGGGKVQALVALYMVQSAVSLFYISDAGEVAAEFTNREIETGLDFAESMGFVLNDVEFNRMSAADKEAYLKGLPICSKHHPVPPESPVLKMHAARSEKVDQTSVSASGPIATSNPKTSVASAAPVAAEVDVNAALDARAAAAQPDLQTKRKRLKESVGRFLASL